VPKSATRETAYEHLNRRVPDECKFDLHVLLVEHGKVYKNDAKWLKQAVQQQLAGAGEVGWVRAMEEPGGIKAAAEQHVALKSSKGGVCG
jgi:hypothetical protein